MRVIWLLLGIGIVVTLWILSLIPRPPHFGFSAEDKVFHALAYAGTMWWWGQLWPSFRHRLALAVGLAAMGVLIEFVQGWSGLRTFDPNDMIANSIGVVLGWCILHSPLGRLYSHLTNSPTSPRSA